MLQTMSRSRMQALLLMLLPILLTACQTTGESGSVNGPVLDKQHRTLAVGESTRVLLVSNKTTGFEWSINQPASMGMDRIAITDSGYATGDASDGMVGAPGRQWWLIKGVKPGEAIIRLVYHRPWEKDVAPARQAVFTIDVRR